MQGNASLIKELVDSVRKHSKGTIYLFGSTLRNFLLSGKVGTLDVVVDEKDKQLQHNILNIVVPGVTFNFIFNSDVDYSHEYYTIDNIYTIITDSFDGNIEILSTNNGLVDLNKKIIKLTKAGKSHVAESPHFIFDTITLVAENKFILDAGTISTFLQSKSSIKNTDPRKVYNFIKSIVGYDHPRKIVSLINALGISKELFDIKLKETSVINHLKPDDHCEFVAVVFTDLDPADLRKALIGFPPKDIDAIKNIISALALIENEDDVTARNIVKAINGYRIQNMIRLLHAIKFKTLAKLVRNQRDSVVNTNKLCINEDTIRSTFNINDEQEIKKILDKALQKVILDPAYNDKYKILTYLHNERI
jgi:hypothetical protein